MADDAPGWADDVQAWAAVAAGVEPPSPPDLPPGLPSVVPVEHVQTLLDRLAGLESDIERVQVIREELRDLRALAKYLTRWRSFYCTRLWLADFPTHAIAKAAGVADSYVSKRAKRFGLPPRRIDKRRDG
jgi:hypothetical protein